MEKKGNHPQSIELSFIYLFFLSSVTIDMSLKNTLSNELSLVIHNKVNVQRL